MPAKKSDTAIVYRAALGILLAVTGWQCLEIINLRDREAKNEAASAELRRDVTSIEVELSAMTAMMYDIRENISQINGNRFTSQDGMQLHREMAMLRERIAALPSEIPPPWFHEMVNAAIAELDQVERRVDDLERACSTP